MNNYCIKSIKAESHKENQDRYFFKKINNNIVVLGVFDGISSNQYSDKAAEICRIVFMNNNFDHLVEFEYEKWFKLKLQAILQRYKEFIDNDHEKTGMATTLNVNVIINNNQLINFNIGDSRTYIVSKKTFKLISKDDILLNYFKDNNIRNVDKKYKNFLLALTNCVEYKENKEIKFTIVKHDLIKDDIVVCCTDGFYKFFEFKKYNFSKNFNVEEFVDIAIDIAIKNKSNDDITLGVYQNNEITKK